MEYIHGSGLQDRAGLQGPIRGTQIQLCAAVNMPLASTSTSPQVQSTEFPGRQGRQKVLNVLDTQNALIYYYK